MAVVIAGTAVCLTLVWAWLHVDAQLTLRYAQQREAEIRRWYQSSPAAVIAVIFVGYMVLTSLPLPGAMLATLVTGWICGLTTGVAVVSFASTTAACVTWSMGQKAARGVMPRRLAPFFLKLRDVPSREVSLYLLVLRLTPGIPFFLVNSGMSLTSIRLRQFWIVSQLGMLPATAFYVYIGSTISDLGEVAQRGGAGIVSAKLLICVLLARCLPLALRSLLVKWRRRTSAGRTVGIADPRPEHDCRASDD